MPVLLGDSRRFLQVLINLLKNAFKFTSSGSISLNVCYDITKRLRVSVSDTGVGIEQADIPKLFTRFGKLQRTADINSEGLGLGLEISNKLCKVYGGEITVNSAGKDQGCTFTFTMQLDPEEDNKLADPRLLKPKT